MHKRYSWLIMDKPMGQPKTWLTRAVVITALIVTACTSSDPGNTADPTTAPPIAPTNTFSPGNDAQAAEATPMPDDSAYEAPAEPEVEVVLASGASAECHHVARVVVHSDAHAHAHASDLLAAVLQSTTLAALAGDEAAAALIEEAFDTSDPNSPAAQIQDVTY